MPIKTLGQIKKGIEELKRQEQFEDYSLVDLEKLLRFELDFKRKMKKKIDISSVFAKDIKEKLEKGEHIADFSNIKIDKKWIMDGLRNICNIRRLCNSELEKAIENGNLDLAGFFIPLLWVYSNRFLNSVLKGQRVCSIIISGNMEDVLFVEPIRVWQNLKKRLVEGSSGVLYVVLNGYIEGRNVLSVKMIISNFLDFFVLKIIVLTGWMYVINVRVI